MTFQITTDEMPPMEALKLIKWTLMKQNYERICSKDPKMGEAFLKREIIPSVVRDLDHLMSSKLSHKVLEYISTHPPYHEALEWVQTYLPNHWD
jgi:hypothetical protein